MCTLNLNFTTKEDAKLLIYYSRILHSHSRGDLRTRVCGQAKAKASKAAPGKVQILLKGAVEGVGKDGQRL